MNILGFIVVVIVYAIFGLIIWALHSQNKQLERDLLEARGMRDYWEGIAESRKED